MNEAEKERLIKKDIVSIENRVRHAFNQGYEMGLKTYKEKLNCTDCIIDGTDACSRGAGRAVDDEICGDFMSSRSEIPNTCDDAISRQAVLNLMRGLTRWCIRSEDGKFNNVGLLYDDVMFGIDKLPSVTPQQRTGRWIQKEEEEPKWIPVSERLPEESKKCLVVFKGGYVGIMCYASDLYGVDEYDFCDEKGKAGWFDYDRELGHYSRDDVIAWLPLPLPYKAESEEKE